MRPWRNGIKIHDDNIEFIKHSFFKEEVFTYHQCGTASQRQSFQNKMCGEYTQISMCVTTLHNQQITFMLHYVSLVAHDSNTS